MKKISGILMVGFGVFWLTIAGLSFNFPQELPSFLRFEGVLGLLAAALGLFIGYCGVDILAKDKFLNRCAKRKS